MIVRDYCQHEGRLHKHYLGEVTRVQGLPHVEKR